MRKEDNKIESLPVGSGIVICEASGTVRRFVS